MRIFRKKNIIPAFVLVGIMCGLLADVLGYSAWSASILLTTLSVGSIPLILDILRSILRLHFGVDLIAIVAIVAAALLGQYLAGTVILLMLSGGEALESYALHRARKDLTDLIERAPTTAHVIEGDTMTDVPTETVQPGTVVLVKSGEMIPVDGEVTQGTAMVDESFLTGESMPLVKTVGSIVMSGSVSTDGVLHVRTKKTSAESKYQQIIRLVREAENHKAPFVRLADRYSVWFTSAAFLLAALAWFLSHDPIRLLAVLVVATPCPLILATPIAFASGISRAAKLGIIVRSGGALEKLGETKSFAFDKTGTLTLGEPKVSRVIGYQFPEADVLRIAASIDQLSPHVLARSLSNAAHRQKVSLEYPADFSETLGEGVTGTINGTLYHFGRLRFLVSKNLSVPDAAMTLHDKAQNSGSIVVFLGNEKEILGAVSFSDEVRPGVRGLFERIRGMGVKHVLMLTGDREAAALQAANDIGLAAENVRPECLPEQKVKEVMRLHEEFPPVVMVGDGINDAPAIAAADVGIAMGGHGSSASSEAGDVVILIDRIERVGDALAIGHRVLRIAKESVFIGMGLSIVLMIIASLGYINPLAGALLQEIIDVIVILNALRALGAGRGVKT